MVNVRARYQELSTHGSIPAPTFDTLPTPEQVTIFDAWLRDPATASNIQKTVRSTNYNNADTPPPTRGSATFRPRTVGSR